MNKKIIIALIAILVIGGGIYYVTSQNKTAPVASDGHTDHSHDDGHMDHSHDGMLDESMSGEHVTMPSGAVLAGTRIIVKNSTFKAGSQNLSFELYGQDGHVFSDAELKVAHEKKMHFIMASSDFSDYQHVHPEFKDKLWQVQVSFKNNTAYQAYVDIESDEDGAETLRVPLTVGTPQAVSKVSQKETTLTKDGIEVRMNAENGFVTGRENPVTFTLSEGGKTIIPENYLGAKGHVVALGDDPNTFVHGHPDDHGDNEIHFAFSFEKAGIYTLFAQFQVGGVVRTYPFTVTVTDATGRTDESKPHTDIVPHN